MTWKPPKPPEGCVSTLEHERELTALAQLLADQAREMLKRGGIDSARGKELALASIRARKIAAGYSLEREAADHVNHLERQQRDLAGLPRNAFHEMRKPKKHP